ncbi:hypothetical protein M2A_2845 [Tepidicaulis marinus]|uniref:Uncharacterized protein n=1 Tax=Tepidicaulis marinus TaxID=1333998 RepID=A0A081BE78_9HYPH|nr:hypothetical protein M2A_2845 [Tepidicaulis marinus]
MLGVIGSVPRETASDAPASCENDNPFTAMPFTVYIGETIMSVLGGDGFGILLANSSVGAGV